MYVQALRKLKFLVVIFVFAVIFSAAFSISTTEEADAARCCWVMVCTVNPPIICWEECRPCPPGPPFP